MYSRQQNEWILKEKHHLRIAAVKNSDCSSRKVWRQPGHKHEVANSKLIIENRLNARTTSRKLSQSTSNKTQNPFQGLL